MRKRPILVVPSLLMLLLAACGGGGDAPSAPVGPGTGALGYTPGEFRASATFAARCLAPRTGTDAWTGRPWPDQPGSALHEKHFLRAWTNETYLWFDEVPDRNPASTGATRDGVLQYFSQLRSSALGDSGRPKDNFHFTYDTDEYRQLASSGTTMGHGISWAVARATVPRQITVEYVQAGTPAAQAGVRRGATLLTVNGVDAVNDQTQAGAELINAALFAPAAGSTQTMTLRDRTGSTITATLPAQQVAFDAVPVVGTHQVGGGRVGYLLFNEHTAVAEAMLKSAVEYLAGAQVNDLVLDLRYNGGGYLDIASELAYMIAGPAATANRAFELQQFSSRHLTHNPVTGEPIRPTGFHATTQGYSLAPGQPLPSLGLTRVYVLTSALTCSASEAIINGLRGIGLQVIQIGGDTCGKPYGFYARDNCGTTYFTIQFRVVNELGFGDYADGFSATRNHGHPMARLPGCAVADDLTRDLGDPLEGQLRAALNHRATGQCPAVSPLSVRPQADLSPADSPAVRKPPAPPWKDNRILRPVTPG